MTGFSYLKPAFPPISLDFRGVLRPHRFDEEIDPAPVQIQARKVHFDVSGIGLHWIPGHPVASNVISLLNVVLPAAERWFVTRSTRRRW